MPTQDWLKTAFDYGYDSGEVLDFDPDPVRAGEEEKIGGSYRRVFCEGCLPFLQHDSKVLELGPGRGSWSRAILRYIPDGELHVADFQDVASWLGPQEYGGRLVCHRVHDNSFSLFPDNYFNLFWSFGVLCHNNLEDISSILTNVLPKMTSGGIAVHQYAAWDKLTEHGWKVGGVPVEFQAKPDDEIWWPRNTVAQMSDAAKQSGWEVLKEDLGFVSRDGIIALRKSGT